MKETKPKKQKNEKVKPILTEEEIKKRKAKKTKVSLSVMVLLLGVGVLGNWYWENSDISKNVSTISSSDTKTLGEATYVDATTETTTENPYFSSARLERQEARDESLEQLQKVVDSSDESEEAHKTAADEIARISGFITIENKIETLITAKGISNCLAIINDDGTTVDIIVDVEELNDTVILQIKEIATEQLSCSYENVTIIQSN